MADLAGLIERVEGLEKEFRDRADAFATAARFLPGDQSAVARAGANTYRECARLLLAALNQTEAET